MPKSENVAGKTPGFWSRGWSLITLMALLAPFVWYCGLAVVYSVEGPVEDDFDAILKFVVNVSHPDHAISISDLTAQHNEHRILTTRLLAWLEYWVFGEISFTSFVVIGNLLHLALVIFLLTRAERCRLSGGWLVPITCLMLAPQFPENAMFPTHAFANLGVHAFAGFALFLWTSRPVISIMCAILAALTGANGLFVAPILFAASLFPETQEAITDGNQPPRNYWRPGPLMMAGLCLAIWGLYFWNYVKPEHHPSVLAALRDPVRYCKFFLALLGSPVRRFGVEAAIATGFVAFVLLVVSLLASDQKTLRSGWVRFLAFEVLTVAAISVARCGFPLDVAFSQRFRHVPLAIMALTSLLLAIVVTRTFSRKAVIRGEVFVLLVASAFNLVSVRDFRGTYQEYFGRVSLQMSDDPHVLSHLYGYPSEERRKFCVRIATEADKVGIYRWPGEKRR